MSTYDKAHFDRLYEADIDPWHFRKSAYEAEKYRATIDAFPQPRFSKCLELGCSIGVLTKLLAARCDAIVAIDTSARALEEAKKICAGLNVDFRQAYLPEGEIGEGYDLVVASEVLYYLDAPSLGALATRLAGLVKPGATCIGVHWTGPTDYPLSGDHATQLFQMESDLARVSHATTDQYRLDVWTFPL